MFRGGGLLGLWAAGRRFPVPSTSLLSLQDVLHWPLIALFPGVFGCVRVSALVCGQFMSAIMKKFV